MTRTFLIGACILLSFTAWFSPYALAQGGPAWSLESVIQYGLQHNPALQISRKNIETEKYNIDAAWAERMPKVDFGSGATRYRYPTPLTPIVITTFPVNPSDLPDFEKTIYDGSASFRLPLYRGGRIVRNIRIAETRKALAEDNYGTTRQDLIYNLASVYHKILQLQKLAVSNEASVTQLAAHKANIELQLKVGSVPYLDLLRTEVELAHARENVLLVRNNLDSAFELLKNLMGMEERNAIAVEDRRSSDTILPKEEQAIDAALAQRPDYQAVARRKSIAEERVRIAQARHFPDVFASGQYSELAGNGTGFKENWYVGIRLTVPVFDGGLIRSEVNRERVELEKTREEERQVRLAIVREVKDARIGIANATDRIRVTETAIESAREALRVELLKYETGAGTNTDVIDARTAHLRAQSDYFQAIYDREVALAALRKATGDYAGGSEVPQ